MKLTLNKTWILCLRMWGWIIKQLLKKDNRLDVSELKTQWLHEHGYTNEDMPKFDCFFCEYAKQQGGLMTVFARGKTFYLCPKCPGRLVSRQFRCEHIFYVWHKCPHKFYKKLVELNNKRLEQRKK